MKKLQDEREFFSSLMDMLSVHMGQDVELVLYSLEPHGGPTILEIRNEYISSGTGGIWVDLQTAEGGWPFKGTRNVCNRIYKLSTGVTLRCSAMCIYDDMNNPIGCLCINQDITKALEAEQYIHNMNHYQGGDSEPFYSNINKVLDSLIDGAQEQLGIPCKELTKDQRIEFIRYLDEHGAFLVTKAGERVCKLLGISKYTLYTDLDIIRSSDL